MPSELTVTTGTDHPTRRVLAAVRRLLRPDALFPTPTVASDEVPRYLAAGWPDPRED